MVSPVRNLGPELRWDFLEYSKESRSQYAKDRALRHFIKPIFNLKGNENILDVGCGIGTVGKLLGPLLNKDGNVIGIDQDAQLVNYGNNHWARRSNMRLEVGNANQVAYPPSFFDIVTSFGLLEFVSNPYHVINEMLRVLKQPGKLIVIHIDTPNYIVHPRNELLEIIYQDLQKAMVVMGIDANLTHFRAFCWKNQHPIEEFTYTLEYRTPITQKYIELVETSMESFYKKPSMVKEVIEFNYQFLKHIGWTKEKVTDFVEYQYTITSHIAFLKEHVGEEYYKKLPIKVYRIQMI